MKNMSDVLDEQQLRNEFFVANMQQIGSAILDINRTMRKGFPEVILAERKNIHDVINLLHAQILNDELAIASRVHPEHARSLQAEFSQGIWYEKARIFIANKQVNSAKLYTTKVAVISAGLSDMTVAEEAAVLLECANYPIHKIYDVGISALHRLLAYSNVIKECEVVIVVAGMDGALPAVIAGLVPQPIIAVPTSIGYGVAQNGMAALNTMLSSCAPGLAVVNIDNGYGAAMMAHAICTRIHKGKKNAK